MPITDHTIGGLDGAPLGPGAYRGTAMLVVNVAATCGRTSQWTGLEQVQMRFADRGFTVIGVPRNQFGGQEPGNAEEIQTFCSTTCGVSSPMTDKVEVNGPSRHTLFTDLAAVPDTDGETGDVQWTYEQFLVSPAGELCRRFRTGVEPESPEVVETIEAALPG